nr:extensin-like [Parasteatoda tepidariorum]
MDIGQMKLISPLPPTPEPQLFEPMSPPMPVASPPANTLKPTPRSIVQVAPSRAHPARIPLVSASDYRSREKRISTSPPRLSNPPKRLKSPISRSRLPTSGISRPPQNSSSHSVPPVDSNTSSQTPVDSKASRTVITSAPPAKSSIINHHTDGCASRDYRYKRHLFP